MQLTHLGAVHGIKNDGVRWVGLADGNHAGQGVSPLCPMARWTRASTTLEKAWKSAGMLASTGAEYAMGRCDRQG